MAQLTDFQQKISALLPNLDIRMNESMAKHTSFRIGGDAEAMAFPKNGKELASVKTLHKNRCNITDSFSVRKRNSGFLAGLFIH